MDNNYINFINGDLRPQTTDYSQSENSNVNYNTSNTLGNVTSMSSQSYPTTSSTSSDLPHPLPQYTQQQIQQVQQPICQQNTENNIQQQFFDATQPIPQNVPHFIQNKPAELNILI
ncbi:unnamed protein product [Rhizophagus irregularis]|nr:unnamed protein product [Rhizophagus irregularis]